MSVVSILSRGALQLRKYSPEILTAAGVVGVVASGVLASRATLKLDEVVTKLETSKEEAANLFQGEAIDQDEFKKLQVKVYRDFVIDLVKLYGPSVTLGAASISAILGGHGITRKRNIAILGAYKGLEQSYNEYRKRVRQEIGEEKEREVYTGLRALDQDETRTDADGKPMALVTDKELTESLQKVNPYARVFDEGNTNWSPVNFKNQTFLRTQQAYLNNRLQAIGHVFLNEVYDALGFERTKEGAVVGWVKDSKGGDNVVDFGFMGYFDNTISSERFLEGDEPSVWLNFNVDGVIWDKI